MSEELKLEHGGQFSPMGIKADQLGKDNRLSKIEERLRIIERQINSILIRLNHLASRPL